MYKRQAGKGSLVLPAFSDDMEPDAYYAMMRRVLEGCHSLLREDGMLFLHCDFRASARLRLIMDDIFGEKNLLNEIVWVYHTGGMARRYFSRKHDTIPVSYTHLDVYKRQVWCSIRTLPAAYPC